jgi:CRISPR-associated protein Cas6
MQYREEDMQSEPKVDLCFQVIGKHVPVDHGYALYGAISRILPIFHEDEATGLKLIRGRYLGEGLLDISPKSELILRLPVNRIADYLPLSGKRLPLGGMHLMVGVPRTKALTPSADLHAHLVTTRNGGDQERFEAEISRQIEQLGVRGSFSVGERRTFKIHGKQVVGYSLAVSGLGPEESITLQENGLGGRRKMGCGFFEPRTG